MLNNLYEILRKHTMYWKFCDQLVELMYKLSKNCKMFANELSKSQNLMNLITTLTRENPSMPVNQGRMKIFREGDVNWQLMNKERKLVNQSKVDQIANYSKQRLNDFTRLVEQH